MFLNADQLNIWTRQTFKLWVRKECDYGLKKKKEGNLLTEVSR